MSTDEALSVFSAAGADFEVCLGARRGVLTWEVWVYTGHSTRKECLASHPDLPEAIKSAAKELRSIVLDANG